MNTYVASVNALVFLNVEFLPGMGRNNVKVYYNVSEKLIKFFLKQR
jgi:hypothetical protein